MASGLLPKSPVSSSLCDEVPHIFIQKSHLEPREFLISSAKRLLQHNLPQADIRSQIHARPTPIRRAARRLRVSWPPCSPDARAAKNVITAQASEQAARKYR